MKHALSEIDTEEGRAVCATCGPVEIRSRRRENGTIAWRCAEAKRAADRERRLAMPVEQRQLVMAEVRRVYGERPYRKNPYRRLVVLDRCARCGYVPEDLDEPVELDVHHRDGDRENNDPENLEVLCSNCHRLVTHAERKRLGAAFTAPRAS